jgi:hypothetical protein
MRAPALPRLLLLAFVGAVLASVACSNQGEGEFCTMANGNNDCQDGLECLAAPGVTGSASVNKNRCCPIPPAQPTTSACALNTSTMIDASTEIPDVISNLGSDAEAGSAPEASAPPTPDAGHADALPE